jgi:preprotein translocase subunit SecD
MTRNLLYRALIVVAATVAALVYLVPSVVAPLPAWWKAVFPDQPIRLGLDLRGGARVQCRPVR